MLCVVELSPIEKLIWCCRVNLKRVNFMTLQGAVVRPVITVLALILWADNRYILGEDVSKIIIQNSVQEDMYMYIHSLLFYSHKTWCSGRP